MMQTSQNPIPKTSVRQPVLLGLFAGTAIGLGFLLSGLPNVELMTVVVALSGAVLGPVTGALCGVLAAAAYGLASPIGSTVPLLLAGQIVGLALAGLLGAWARRPVLRLLQQGRLWPGVLFAAGLGMVATLAYDLLTNLAYIVAFEVEPLVVLVGAVPLTLVHVGVNLIAFATVWPVVLPRLAYLRGEALIGTYARTGAMVLLLAGGPAADRASAQETEPEQVPDPPAQAVAIAPDDTTGIPTAPGVLPDGVSVGPQPPLPDQTPELYPRGWRRPLWQPFWAHTPDWFQHQSSLVVMLDGGIGAPAMLLSEATTSPSPTFLQNGLPVGTGHALADDPWLVMLQGTDMHRLGGSTDGWGGTDGVVEMTDYDPTPDRAYSVYRGVKGPHESYHRAVSLLTPATAWRLSFDFEENLDNEGYNYTELPDESFNDVAEDRGQGKVRSGRARLVRQLGETESLTVTYGTTRKTKDELPSWDAEHQEIWGSDISATARGQVGAWTWRGSLFFVDRDVQWGDRPVTDDPPAGQRKVETGREGLLVEFGRPQQRGTTPGSSTPGGTHVSLRTLNWRVHDHGLSDSIVAMVDGPVDGEGQEAVLDGRHRFALGAAAGLDLKLAAQWQDRAGLKPAVGIALGQPVADPWWRIDIDSGGRAPRSDELFTPIERDVIGQGLLILPNQNLTAEKTLRCGLLLQRKLLGTGLAVDASWRRLTSGVTWRQDPDSPDTGRLANDLEMDSSRITGRIERDGRLWGWGRAMLEGTWRNFDERQGRASRLPPETSARLVLMWENHFFKEDGILQLSWFTTYRSEMDDPWDPSRSVILPSATLHDLLIGFRLVGAHISVAVRNVTDQPVRLSSNSLSTGREWRWRLSWAFYF